MNESARVFSEDRTTLRDVARELFASIASPAELREIWGGKPRNPEVWRQIAALGVPGILVPEEHGGMGGSLDDLILVVEEAGRACLSEPLVETAVVAPIALAATNDRRAHELLSRLAGGGAKVATSTHKSGLAPYAADADALLELDDNGARLSDRDQFVTESSATQDPGRAACRVRTSGMALDVTTETVARAYAHGAVATAAALNGVSLRLLEMSVDHAKTRQQFGSPIGSFQAVAHKLAAHHVALECARAATWHAASALSNSADDSASAAATAKVLSVRAEAPLNLDALQIHGGIGFTWEHDLHFWLKRGQALRDDFGSAREHRAWLGARAVEGSSS